MDKFMDVENYEYYREGYYYRASGGHSWFYIFLTIEKNNVTVEVREQCQICSNEDYGILENGDKHEYAAGGDLVFSINIWHKHFFPEFNEENNQWYHGSGDDDRGCMSDIFDVFKFAYDLALKESGIKPY